MAVLDGFELLGEGKNGFFVDWTGRVWDVGVVDCEVAWWSGTDAGNFLSLWWDLLWGYVFVFGWLLYDILGSVGMGVDCSKIIVLVKNRVLGGVPIWWVDDITEAVLLWCYGGVLLVYWRMDWMNLVEVIKFNGFGNFVLQKYFHSSVLRIYSWTQFWHWILSWRFRIGLSKTGEHLLLLLRTHSPILLFSM